jgi:predicted aspartyl protease
MLSSGQKPIAALWVGLCFILLSSAAPGEAANLKSLYDTHQCFELRNSVAKGDAPAFYQGAVACAFGGLHRCKKKLRDVIRSRPQSNDAVEAHRILISAYIRSGKYREAMAQINSLLAISRTDHQALSDGSILAILSEFPDQQTARKHSTTLELQDAGIPISINGAGGIYWFDTGAEFSIMNESDAKRFGLRVVETPVKEGDVNGTQFGVRVGIADELSIGSMQLKHVAFLVTSDKQPPFNEAQPGSRGLLGMPVLFALQRFSWADKKFEIEQKPQGKNNPHADMCFDRDHPLVQLEFEDRKVAFTLDTGASNTDLYPPFATAFPELIQAAGEKKSYQMEGVGGAKQLNAAMLSGLHFSIGGLPVVLQSAAVVPANANETSKFIFGNLGIDLLQQAHKTTFDFKAMTLTLQ